MRILITTLNSYFLRIARLSNVMNVKHKQIRYKKNGGKRKNAKYQKSVNIWLKYVDDHLTGIEELCNSGSRCDSTNGFNLYK